MEKLYDAIRDSGLTGRQAEIVMKVMEGHNNRDIGKALGITEKTVKFHLTNIFKITNNRDRFALAIWGHNIKKRVDPQPVESQIDKLRR